MKKSIFLVVLAFGCLPAKALASDITCTVTGTNAVTIMESANEATENGAATCKITGVALPSSAAVVNLLENPLAPDFDSKKPISDFIEITPGGNIVLLSDGESGQPEREGGTNVGPEPLGFGPVVFSVAGTTYTVFSDVTPEPSTILLVGSGLFALFARKKIR